MRSQIEPLGSESTETFIAGSQRVHSDTLPMFLFCLLKQLLLATAETDTWHNICLYGRLYVHRCYPLEGSKKRPTFEESLFQVSNPFCLLGTLNLSDQVYDNPRCSETSSLLNNKTEYKIIRSLNVEMLVSLIAVLQWVGYG